jgi:hypothetical protein
VYAFHDYRQGQQRLRSGHHVQSEAFGRDGNIQRRIDQGRILLAGEGLDPTSNGTRVTFSGNKRTVVDGPFTKTKELIAGFWLWNVKSKEEAIEWVKRCPNPHNKDSEIEIRQWSKPKISAPALRRSFASRNSGFGRRQGIDGRLVSRKVRRP